MSHISSISARNNRYSRRIDGVSRAFEAKYYGSANATPDSPHTLFIRAALPPEQAKPRMWQCPTSRLWKCQIDTVVGTGTNKKYAWSQLWALLSITHPWLKKPAASK